MRTMNRVFLMGYLGQAPELSLSKAGKPYTRLNLATHTGHMNNEDQWEEKTDWHSVFLWGTLAETCVQNLRKGSLVFVEGTLTYWKVAQQDNYKNAVHGHEVKFLSQGRSDAPAEAAADTENLDIPSGPRNHNAVAHPA
jgi:single-strand DNA-binding protein